MNPRWSDWRFFPDPRKCGMLIAPFGPGCYELRIGKQLLLYGRSGHVARRLSSLLPKPIGCGTRRNAHKRASVYENLGRVEYRTLACACVEEAVAEERRLRARGMEYLHPS